MAFGDPQISLVNVTSGALQAAQPPSTEAWAIRAWGSDAALGTTPDVTPRLDVGSSDGLSNLAVWCFEGMGWSASGASSHMVTSSERLLIKNQSGTQIDMWWSSVEVPK